MRRTTLALALVGAVAAAGCGQTSKPADSGNRGVEGSSFKLTVRGEKNFTDAGGTVFMLPEGGRITGNGIDCGYDAAGVAKTTCEASVLYGTAVSLTVANFYGTNQAVPPQAFDTYGFAGACTGAGSALATTACTFTMNADRFVGVRFGRGTASLGSHGDWHDPAVHAAQYLELSQGTGLYNCVDCHGAQLQGAGLAPSCSTCHSWPIGPHMAVTNSSHNSGGCARCHVGDGFRDYIGADNVVSTSAGMNATADDHLDSYTAAAGYAVAQKLDGATFAKDMKCNMCHNAATVLGDGTVTGTLNQIRFPSATYQTAGITVTVDTVTAICGQCHTNVRDSDRNIQQLAVQLNGVTDLDAQLATANNKQIRPHYLGAASTFLGSESAVFAQIAGNIYTARNEHGGLAKCTACHNAHTGDLPADGTMSNQILGKCGGCHFDETTGQPVSTFAQLEESRQFGFEGDIDGDGTVESVKLEIEGLKAKLAAAIRAYSLNIPGGGTDICMNVSSAGLFEGTAVLVDSGVACGTAPNNGAFTKFTARLLRAQFNFGMVQNDLGAWAHNPRYVIEILYDAIADLNAGLVAKGVNSAVAANGKRAFNGHFGAAEDASPYAAMIYHGGANAITGEVLPNMGFTSAACYQCHGGKVGYDAYLTGAPAAIAAIPAGGKVNAMQCSTCHTLNGENMTAIRSVATVYVPPQKASAADAGQVSFTAAQLPPGFGVCATCHAGRENGATITKAIGTKTDANWAIAFKNPHYLGAAGVMLGSNAAVMYQYGAASTYTGYPVFWSTGQNGAHGSPHGAKCASCHAAKGSKHTFEIALGTTVPTGTWAGAFPLAGMQPGAVNTAACTGCHAGPYALEPKALEFEEASAELYAALRTYVGSNAAAAQTGVVAVAQAALDTAIAGGDATKIAAAQATFDWVTTPANALVNVCYVGASNPYFFIETASGCSTTAFAAFNPTSLKAAYNYQWTQKEPGAWAHNEFYTLQVIYDSIVGLGGAPTFKVAAVTSGTPAVPVPGDPLNRGY